MEQHVAGVQRPWPLAVDADPQLDFRVSKSFHDDDDDDDDDNDNDNNAVYPSSADLKLRLNFLLYLPTYLPT